METDDNQTIEYFKRPHPIWYGLIIPSMIYLSVSFLTNFHLKFPTNCQNCFKLFCIDFGLYARCDPF